MKNPANILIGIILNIDRAKKIDTFMKMSIPIQDDITLHLLSLSQCPSIKFYEFFHKSLAHP